MTTDVPPIVAQAAVRAARDHRGIVGYRLVQKTELHAARFYNRSDTFEMVAVFDGDTLLGVRILRYTQNGRDSTPDEKSAIKHHLESAGNRPGFAVPFDARHFAEYRYTDLGTQGVRFVSLLRDARHGDGTFQQNGSGDVIRMMYTPDVLPQHASSATIADERAEVLPGFWATVRETQQYEGHYGPFRGNGDIVTLERDFKRFPNRAAALAALEHGDI